MATLGARVDDDFLAEVTKAALAAGMKVSGYIVEAVKEKMAAGISVNARQLNLLDRQDHIRLAAQRETVMKLMLDGAWRSLPDIAAVLGLPDSSIPSVSARLRDLRKKKYGGYIVNKREPRRGYFEYQLQKGE